MSTSSDPAPITPRAFVRTFNSADEYMASNGLAGARLNARASDPFSASLARIDLGAIRIRQGEASSSVSLAGAAPDNHAFVFATRPAPDRILSGFKVPPDALFHPRPNDELFAASPTRAPWPWASVGIAYSDLARLGPVLAGRDVAPSRLDTALVKPPEAARLRLLRLVADAAELAAKMPGVAEIPTASHAMAGAITEALVACLAGGEIEPDRAAVRRHHQVMARLERVLDENPEKTLTVAEICAAAGVARRSLHLICWEFTGTSVMNYARARRFSRVRQALRTADPQESRVTDIAAHFGFWELHRFAAAYRSLFGELPSETLRRNGG